MRRAITIAASMLLSSCGFAQRFMPENNLHLETNLAPTMGEREFNQALDKIQSYYGPIIKDNFGATLKIERRWSDTTVNAYAYQSGRTWNVTMFGGLARRVTTDGFLAVACHELGHHLSGYPFVSPWAGNEGQSDLFATQVCLRKILGDEPSQAVSIPSIPKGQCDAAYEGLDDRRLCYRIMMAGKSLGDLLSSGRAKFETTDRSQVTQTNDRHPLGQCRLDTYMAGAVCAKDWDDGVIPGKNLGTQRNSAQAERDSAEVTCHTMNGDKLGVRPRCWFAPKIK